MKNFDEARAARRKAALEQERGFQIGGQTFVRRVEVKPDSLLPLDRVKPAKRDADGKVLEAGSGVGDDIGAMDDVILAMIDPDGDAHARYKQLRAQDDDVLTLDDLRDLMEWLIEQVTVRPTLPPSPSTPSPVTSGT